MTSTDPSTQDTLPAGIGLRGALLLGLVTLLLLSFLPLQAPQPLGPEAPVEAFSADRAFEHVEALAAEPHPVGSQAHARARQELVRRIEALGLEPRVQRAVAARSRAPGVLRTAWVHNVMTRLEGSAGEDHAVLLVAHYDSVAEGPGAADDAAGVAALLETLRALRAGAAPVHDVIALFTDAEEWGLLGAEAFLAEHPWAQDVRLVLNYEARGASGPSIMFETGPGTGTLMRRFARVTPHPLAASYSHDVYRRLPNDTDFTLFKAEALPGFNFAFIHDSGKYHTPLDTPRNLSPGSLQHHGDHALSLARHFASTDDLDDLPRGGPATSFALPGLGLVVYPSAWAPALAGLVALAALALWVVGYRRGRLSLGGILGYGLLTLVAVALGTVLIVLLHRAIAGPLGLYPSRLATPGIYLLGLVLLTAALVAWPLLRIDRGKITDRLAGVTGIWVFFSLAAAVAVPSSSYLVTWPLAGLLLVLGSWVLRRRPPSPALRVALLLVAALPALWLLAPTMSLIGAAFGPAGVGPLVLSLLGALLTTLLLPQLRALAGGGRGRTWLAAVLVVLGILAIAETLVTAGYSPQRPRPTHVVYSVDADAGDARWGTVERHPSEWTRQFVEAGAERVSWAPYVPSTWPPLRTVPAPAAPLAPPEIERLRVDVETDGRRRVHLRLDSPLGGNLLRLLLSSESTLVGLRLADRELDMEGQADDDPFVLEVVALPPEGLPLEVTLGGGAPLEVDAIDRAHGLPEIEGFPWTPRPDNLMPSMFAPTDLRMVRKQYIFETTPPTASQETDGGST